MFTMPFGQPIRPDWMRSRFLAITGDLDVRAIRLHDLRHTWATVALLQGVHPKVVSECLGHANIAVTLDTYSHVSPGMAKAAVQSVSAAVFGEV